MQEVYQYLMKTCTYGRFIMTDQGVQWRQFKLSKLKKDTNQSKDLDYQPRR